MNFPEFLYRLTPRDQQVTQLEKVMIKLEVTTNATSLTTSNYTVPNGKLLLIEHVMMRWLTNDATTPTCHGLYMQVDQTGSNDAKTLLVYNSTDVTINGNARRGGTNASMQVIVPEGHFINFTGGFTGATASNQIFGHIQGILLPRGTFAI